MPLVVWRPSALLGTTRHARVRLPYRSGRRIPEAGPVCPIPAHSLPPAPTRTSTGQPVHTGGLPVRSALSQATNVEEGTAANPPAPGPVRGHNSTD